MNCLKICLDKTGAKADTPLNIGLNIIDTDLEAVILRCHDFYRSADTITAPSEMLTLSVKMLTKYFAKTREATGLKWDNTSPGFHEIRSFSARFYTEQHGDISLRC
ncbi:site-specific integrase [Erwinia typographi]|uniref:hypothetical protein n=1 Tax=Erwinia typographi TaxID=371042 RepID=UPI0012ED3A6F|nr:hypothetical protein [Erwinia typographi]